MSTRVRDSAMKPRAPPDFNGDRATIDVRQELLANLTSVHLKAVECVVLEKYVLLEESMPQELRGAFPEALRNHRNSSGNSITTLCSSRSLVYSVIMI